MAKNSLATISQPQTSKPPVSSSDAIRQFLVKAGEIYSKQITAPLVSIWLEALAGYRVEVLESLFGQAFRNCKFFPTPADVLEPVKKAEEGSAPLEAELKWANVLAYANSTSPDIPERNRPKISERTQAAIRAAGGIAWIRDCSRDDLVWAKKAFVQTYVQWDAVAKAAFALPEGEIQKLFAQTAERLLPQ
jgi:hypothetical protein